MMVSACLYVQNGTEHERRLSSCYCCLACWGIWRTGFTLLTVNPVSQRDFWIVQDHIGVLADGQRLSGQMCLLQTD